MESKKPEPHFGAISSITIAIMKKGKQLDFRIIETELEDLPFIYGLFDQAIVYQKAKGFPVWPSYDRAGLREDIQLERQFKVIQEEDIACIFTITLKDEIVWRERDRGDALYLHRVVVNPVFKGNRLFGHIMDWAIRKAQELDLVFLRMDTWGDNPNLISYYQEFGFQIIEYWQTPNSKALPIQQRGNKVVLLEYKC